MEAEYWNMECADNGMFYNVYETCDGMISSR